ncbi:unnamed protein product [Darwinula stevensoni]|uniref:Uncharacterized protein n=1 Tax=Darwinula stevensoni TaxID=69355 RepID=A0A7R8X169_9CRUS|nr:unnamed protein product [Darwinula stevensoni]CAG0879660.1 unnamed protein product [Darwinula stevensoni]
MAKGRESGGKLDMQLLAQSIVGRRATGSERAGGPPTYQDLSESSALGHICRRQTAPQQQLAAKRRKMDMHMGRAWRPTCWRMIVYDFLQSSSLRWFEKLEIGPAVYALVQTLLDEKELPRNCFYQLYQMDAYLDHLMKQILWKKYFGCHNPRGEVRVRQRFHIPSLQYMTLYPFHKGAYNEILHTPFSDTVPLHEGGLIQPSPETSLFLIFPIHIPLLWSLPLHSKINLHVSSYSKTSLFLIFPIHIPLLWSLPLHSKINLHVSSYSKRHGAAVAHVSWNEGEGGDCPVRRSSRSGDWKEKSRHEGDQGKRQQEDLSPGKRPWNAGCGVGPGPPCMVSGAFVMAYMVADTKSQAFSK